jgi:abhydrolase domain-containing protein 6
MLKSIQDKLHRIRKFLFQKAIAAEYKSAGQSASIASLSFGRMAYLQNSRQSEREAIVMLHGFGADKSSWVRFARRMDSRRRLVIPDLAGHGESAQDASLDYGIAQQAERLDEFLKALGIEKAHLIANSMGCAIALRFADTHPQAVASLVLMDAAGVERTPSRLQLQIRETGRNPMTEIENVDDYRAMMRFGMESPPYIPGIFINLLAEEKIKRRNIESKMLGDIENDLDQVSILGNIRAPTLIIWGAQDRVVHVDDADLLHEKIVGSEKVILAGVGHAPMVENPKLAATLCVAFLNELAVDAGMYC